MPRGRRIVVVVKMAEKLVSDALAIALVAIELLRHGRRHTLDEAAQEWHHVQVRLRRVVRVDARQLAQRKQLGEQRHVGTVLCAGEPLVERDGVRWVIVRRVRRRARLAHEIAHFSAAHLGGLAAHE